MVDIVRRIIDTYGQDSLYIGLGASNHNIHAQKKISKHDRNVLSIMIDPAFGYKSPLLLSYASVDFPGCKIKTVLTIPPEDLDAPGEPFAVVFNIARYEPSRRVHGKNARVRPAVAAGIPTGNWYVAYVKYNLPGPALNLTSMEQYSIDSCIYFRKDEHYNRCKVGNSPIGLYLLDIFNDKLRNGKMVIVNNQIVFNQQVFVDERSGALAPTQRLVRTNIGYYFEAYVCWMLDIFDKLAELPRVSELMFVCISTKEHIVDINKYMANLCKIPIEL